MIDRQLEKYGVIVEVMRVFPSTYGLIVSVFCGLSLSSAAPVSFVTEEVEYRLGESVMIPLRVDAPVTETTALELKSQKQGIIEILRQPEILKDQDIGFARIRTITPGEVVLKCGDASIRVRVTKERPVSLLRKLTPLFTSPAANSSVWGKVAVGADIWVGAPGVDRASQPDAKLILPDGRELKADEAFPPMDGPFWRIVYYLDTASLPPGPCKLTLSCKPPLTGGAAGMEPLVSETHTIHILPAPKDGDIVLSGECENLLDTPRSERMGPESPMVIMDTAASGHRAVALHANRQSWVIQPDIAED